MGRLTTHVLYLTTGKPAQGLEIELWSLEDDTSVHLKTVQTNEDGRVDEPLLKGGVLITGIYELRFKAGEYLSRQGLTLPDPLFWISFPSVSALLSRTAIIIFPCYFPPMVTPPTGAVRQWRAM